MPAMDYIPFTLQINFFNTAATRRQRTLATAIANMVSEKRECACVCDIKKKQWPFAVSTYYRCFLLGDKPLTFDCDEFGLSVFVVNFACSGCARMFLALRR